jgi:hypothetical protein
VYIRTKVEARLPLQVRQAIRELTGSRKLAAAMKLRYLAEDVCAIFNVHVRDFIANIWEGLRDKTTEVREASVQALRVRVPTTRSYQESWLCHILKLVHGCGCYHASNMPALFVCLIACLFILAMYTFNTCTLLSPR